MARTPGQGTTYAVAFTPTSSTPLVLFSSYVGQGNAVVAPTNGAPMHVGGFTSDGEFGFILGWLPQSNLVHGFPGPLPNGFASINGLSVVGANGYAAGQVTDYDNPSFPLRAVYWTYTPNSPNSQPMTTFVLHRLLPANCTNSVAWDVQGTQSVGIATFPGNLNRAYLWNGTNSAIDLHPPNYLQSWAQEIAGNMIVGSVSDGTNKHAAFWNTAGQFVGEIHPAVYVSSEALACNGTQIVGTGVDTAGTRHAVLWTSANAAGARDLNALPALASANATPTGIDRLGNITLASIINFYNLRSWVVRPTGAQLRMKSVAFLPGSVVELTWEATPGKTYQVQYKDSLGAAAWQNVGAPVPTLGAEGTSAPTAPGVAMRFYRVAEVP